MFCRDCKWWLPNDPITADDLECVPDYANKSVRDPLYPAIVTWHALAIEQRRCGCPRIVDVSGPNIRWHDLPDDAAGYEDSKGYKATFRTGPLFGCLHFSSP